MDFSLSEHDRTLAQQVAAFCANGLPQRSSASPFYSRAQWHACGTAGLLGLSIPTEYGGRGLGAVSTAVAMHAFGQHCEDMGLVFGAAAHLFACAMPIVEFGTEELKSRVLPKLASGEWIGSNAITEPDAGSDSSALTTRAEKRSDGDYTLHGYKSFAANAPVADVYVTYGTVDPSFGALGVTGFVVDARREGIERTGPWRKCGLQSCPSGGVRFSGVVVPKLARLGEEGMGGKIFQHSMGWERACLFAGFVGMMERQLSRATLYAKQRHQFGRAIAENQAISHRLVEMKLRLECARLLLMRACWGMDRGEAAQLEIALSKLAISEAALTNSVDAIRIFGGRGYLTETGIEVMLRDAMGSVIFSGTSDMQREIAAKEMGL